MLLNYDGSIEHHKLSLKIVQNLEKAWVLSGGSRNLERGVRSPARFARRKFLGCHAHFRSRERIHTKYSWKAEPRGPSQKKSRTLSDSVVLVNYNFN